jgi:hypothetical protein
MLNWKECKGAVMALVELLSGHLRGGLRKTSRSLSLDSET